MRASAIFVVLSAAVASAKSPPTNYSSELEMTLDPNTLPSSEKGKPAVWCKAQTETCNTLCDNNTGKNSCNKETLKYDCTCASNNSAPGLQFYTQTMPTFICQEVFSQCNKANVGNADGQMDCTNKIQSKCGTLDPPKLSSGGGGGKGGSGSDDSSSSTEASKPTSSQTSDRSAVTSSTSGGLAAPTMAPAGNRAAAAAAVIGFLAYWA